MLVDDILIVSSLAELKNIKQKSAEQFLLTDNGQVKMFLGMKIERKLDMKIMTISHEEYFEKLLNRFNMTEYKPISIPIENRLKLSKEIKHVVKLIYRANRKESILNIFCDASWAKDISDRRSILRYVLNLVIIL